VTSSAKDELLVLPVFTPAVVPLLTAAVLTPAAVELDFFEAEL
jgi:hypothetical protein